MRYISSKKGRLLTLILSLVLTIIFGILSFSVKTNYDMSTYLPEDSNTKQGLEILETTFGNHASVDIVVNGLSTSEVIVFKNEIKALPYIYSVIWLDDYVDLSITPIDFVPDKVRLPFYNDGKSKITVEFTLSSYDTRLKGVIEDIKDLAETKLYMRGEILNNLEAHEVAASQLWLIMAIIVPICILILVFVSRSYIESLLILVTLGIAIVLNLGTNGILGKVSFITMTMGMALQLAMSLDYSLFLIHRYHEYSNLPVIERVTMALKKSFTSITASSLTTIFGFIALCFMSYRIGIDIGLVLAKGIFLSYLSTIILLPVLLVISNKCIDKTTHKSLLPSFKGISHVIYKYRKGLLVLFLIISGLGFYYQGKADYLYQNAPQSSSELKSDQDFIEANFGPFNPIVVIVKGEDVAKEVALVQSLMAEDNVLSVSALVTAVDPSIPRDFIPVETKANFIRSGYSRFIINTAISSESDAFYALNKAIIEKTEFHFDEAYFIGVIPATSDIKSLILSDTALVLWISIALVALVIGVAFKSILIPLLLVLVIESSIWVNMAINALSGTEIIYIGYLVILSIQLGATIDYAVLLTSRYLEERKVNSHKEAYINALEKSIPSILISAFILSVAGFIEAIVSDMEAIQDIGIMLGRGTIISFLFSILFVLILIDIEYYVVSLLKKRSKN
ncbi:MMPL family transporter [Acholeplasma vituli]|uniref:MMPL family transporter n=1 Tax=Paracholeplasma vituli TaxID=69473 RepID=A0ABT2PVP3_9MOLU|nr:MMPL family transporter [Paracholeplasma vituli]MCU0104476.1 MMPL family transporter [Paracholeplasma vituli]